MQKYHQKQLHELLRTMPNSVNSLVSTKFKLSIFFTARVLCVPLRPALQQLKQLCTSYGTDENPNLRFFTFYHLVKNLSLKNTRCSTSWLMHQFELYLNVVEGKSFFGTSIKIHCSCFNKTYQMLSPPTFCTW